MSNKELLYWEFPNHISKDLIDVFLKEAEAWPVAAGKHGEVNPKLDDFRKVSVQSPTEYNFMCLLLLAFGIKANAKCWAYDIWDSNQADLLTYYADTSDRYNGHVDTLQLGPGVVRKLTVLAFLNDDYEGGKFFLLQSENNKQYIETTAGSVIVFPSHIMHGVEPVTAGVRKSLATWIIGPNFK